MARIPAETRFIKVELLHRKRPAGEKPVHGAKARRRVGAHTIEIGESHVWSKSAPFARMAGARERRGDLRLQMRQSRLRSYARPKGARLAIAEKSATGQCQVEPRRDDARQGGMNVLEIAPVRLADKLQGDVERFLMAPARALKPDLELRERVGDDLGQRQSDEEPVHDGSCWSVSSGAVNIASPRKDAALTDREIVFLGYGYTARALARRLKPAGWRVAATARTGQKAALIARDGARAIPWTEAGIDPAAFDGASAVLVSTPPGEDGCPALAAAGEALAGRADAIDWIGYLSSNGVYGDHGGAWVDEFSPLRAVSRRGLRRIAAEADWASLGATFDLPVVIFRLPGIYGPGRSALDAVRDGRARRIVKDGQVFNRMHVDDIAAALEASLARPAAGALFNLADDLPSPPQDVIEYACALLAVEPPPPIPFEEAELSHMGRSFYLENKRVRNDRMKQALGVALAYPTYREGLRAILAGEEHT